MNLRDAKVDWHWVKKRIYEKEKIRRSEKNMPKNAVQSSLDECLKEAKSLVKPRMRSVTKKVFGLGPNSIDMEGGVSFSTKKLPAYLGGANHIYLFLATIGDELEKRASRLMSQGEPLRGYLLDRIGSFAVESLAQGIENGLRKYYESKGKRVSMRFSPGYCDWGIEEQYKLNDLVDFSKLGVSLTKSCMMNPKKSISAMIGIGPKGAFKNSVSPCRICGLKECDHRRD